MEIRRLIRGMSMANRLWGAPRIHGELLKLGIEVAQSTVAKYMARSGRGRSQTWKTFLHNHASGIGAMDFLIEGLRPVLRAVGIPPEILPMAITRPLTSSGSIGVLSYMIKQYGMNSLYVKMAAVIFGSSETTFYVIAVYFGSVGVTKVRHAVLAGLIAEGSAILGSIYLVKWMYG